MSILIGPAIVNGTTNNGTFSVNTVAAINGIIRQILVLPTSAGTSYDIKLVDSKGHKVYERLSETDELSELTDIPAKGILTFTITNATKDEDFTAKLVLQS